MHTNEKENEFVETREENKNLWVKQTQGLLFFFYRHSSASRLSVDGDISPFF